MIIQIYWIIISLSILIAFAIVIKDIRAGKYKLKSNTDSFLSIDAEKRYKEQFPEHSIIKLKQEIEKVADILIENEESNRYTEALRQKANKDARIRQLRDAAIENVEIVKYVNDVLKARIKYKDYEYEYSLILSMNTVATGRVFLNDYFIFKDKIKITN